MPQFAFRLVKYLYLHLQEARPSDPLIFYEKKRLHHDLDTANCKFKCRFTTQEKDIHQADLVVFKTGHSIGPSIKAPIGYESQESPVHMAKFSEDAKSKVKIVFIFACSYLLELVMVFTRRQLNWHSWQV